MHISTLHKLLDKSYHGIDRAFQQISKLKLVKETKYHPLSNGRHLRVYVPYSYVSFVPMQDKWSNL